MTKMDLHLVRSLVSRELKRIELDYNISAAKVSSRVEKEIGVMGETVRLLPNKVYELPRYVSEMAAEEGTLEKTEDEFDVRTISQVQWLESSYEGGLSKLPPFFYQRAKSFMRKLNDKSPKSYTETESTLLALVDLRLNKMLRLVLSRTASTSYRDKMQHEELILYEFIRAMVDTWREVVLNYES